MSDLPKDNAFGLADMMAEDILATSDKELLEEIAEDYGDVTALANEFDSIAAPIIEKMATEPSRATASAAAAAPVPPREAQLFAGRKAERRAALRPQAGRTFWSSVFGNLGPLGGTYQMAIASLAVLVVAIGVGSMLVDEFSSGDVKEQSTPSASSSPAQSSAVPQSYFADLATGATETEAQAIFRALQARFPSLLASREPVIRPSAGADPQGTSRYVLAVGPFASMEQAEEFCNEVNRQGAACTPREYRW
jgi:hypothetical protein